jgi:hypothetical protein
VHQKVVPTGAEIHKDLFIYVQFILRMVSVPQTTVNNEVKRMWYVTVMAQFKVLSQHLPAEAQYQTPHQNRQS